MTTQKHRNDSRTLLAQARAELAQGDVRQASEKGWGAAALMLKAIAEQRGWEHGKHRHLSRVASRLRAETGDRDIYRWYQVADALQATSMRMRRCPRISTTPLATWSASWTSWSRCYRSGTPVRPTGSPGGLGVRTAAATARRGGFSFALGRPCASAGPVTGLAAVLDRTAAGPENAPSYPARLRNTGYTNHHSCPANHDGGVS